MSRNSGERPALRSFFHGHEIPVCPSRNDGVCVTKFRTSSADGPRAHPGPSEIARDWGRDCNLATRSLQPSTPPPCLKPTGRQASTAVCMHTTDVTVIATTDNCHRYRHHRNKALLQVCVLWRRVCLNAPTSAHACVSVRSLRRARLRSSVCNDWLTQVGGVAL